MTNSKILYESFNARYLNYQEIANLFIENKQYNQLVENAHSLLMGPRGSGKTTLLKMLTIPAQHYFSSRIGAEKILKPSFFAVYIPTDVQWKKQMDELEKTFSTKLKYQQVISKLVVSTNVLISLCDTFAQIIQYKIANEEDLLNESKLCEMLIKDWRIASPVSTNLASLKHALLGRMTQINSHAKRVHALDMQEDQIDYPDYFFDDFHTLVPLGCDSFEQIFSKDPSFEKAPFKWALCFDELEIAPDWLKGDLLSLLRSTTAQNILYKLTMVPIVSVENNSKFYALQAREFQDFSIIRTWTYSRESMFEWEKFSRKLLADKLHRNFTGEYNLLSIFGPDNLDYNIVETFKQDKTLMMKGGYGEGTPIWLIFRELARVDKSFRTYLKDIKKIDPQNPIPIEKSQEDEVFRKLKPIVVHRYQLRSHVVFGRRRSRKNTSLYYGIPFLFHFSDGNPRTLIGLIEEFLNILNRNRVDAPKRLHISVQNRVVYKASRKYLEAIRNHPGANVPYLNKYINLGALLERIGDYFNDKMINDDFQSDPANSFIVDSAIPQSIIELLTVAMHLGAIIYLDPQESLSSDGLVGKRFRLSYFLFPYFNIPVVSYKEVSLSSILRRGTDKIDQLLLFDPK